MDNIIVGPHAVRTGQIVYVNDSNLVLGPLDAKSTTDQGNKQFSRQPDIQLRFALENLDPLFQARTGVVESAPEILVTAHTSMFGADLTAIPPAGVEPVRFGRGEGVRVSRDKANRLGCLPYDRTFDNDAVLVYRGDCDFLEKLTRAKFAGASGVVVISNEEEGINPSAEGGELAIEDLGDVAMVVLVNSAGKLVTSMLDFADAHGMGRVVLMVEPEGHSATTDGRQAFDDQKEKHGRERMSGPVLYINGHALLNTRLVV